MGLALYPPYRTPTQCLHAAFNPPTVEVTKRKFLELYDRPISAMYETVLQELLVQQHFMRYNISYKYDEVGNLFLNCKNMCALFHCVRLSAWNHSVINLTVEICGALLTVLEWHLWSCHLWYLASAGFCSGNRQHL